MTNFSQAFDKTLRDFGISGKWLSEQSGVSEQMISGFRKGKQRIYSDSLEKLIQALPFEVQQHFYSVALGQSIQAQCTPLMDQLESMNPLELAAIIRAIADLMETRNITSDLAPVKMNVKTETTYKRN